MTPVDPAGTCRLNPLRRDTHDESPDCWLNGTGFCLSADMPTPFESALLNLKLYDLRREPMLREARAWFLRDFNPDSLAELGEIVSGERKPPFAWCSATGTWLPRL